MDYFEKEKIQNRKLGGLKNSLNALTRKLLYSGRPVKENYGQREIRMFREKMQRTFTSYDINPYTNQSAKELIKKLDKLDERVMTYNG